MPLHSLIYKNKSNQNWKNPFWIMVISAIVFIFIWKFPFTQVGVGLNNYTPLHTLLEIISVILSGIILTVGWQYRHEIGITRIVLCATGFLGVALLDISHILSFEGMPTWVTPAGGGKAIYFWFAARFLAAFSILMLIAGSELRTFRKGTEWWALSGVVSFVVVINVLVLSHQDWLPVFIIEGKGLTTAKIDIEWLLIFILASTMFLVWRNRGKKILFDSKIIMLALWMSVMSELCFTLYSNASDIFNLMGHIFKLMSYGFLYQAIIGSNLHLHFKSLSQGQALIHQMVNHIPQVFWMTSTDKNKILYVSPAYEDIWQLPVQQLLDNPNIWLDTVHPEDRKQLEHNFSQQSKAETVFEYRIVRADGSERWIRTKTFPFHDINNETRIAGVSEDITNQVKAAESVYKKESLLNQAQVIAHLGSWDYDVNTRCFSWSDEMFRIFGFDPQSFEPTFDSFVKHTHPDDREAVEKFYANSLTQNTESFEISFRIIKNNTKDTRYVNAKYSHARDVEGRVVGSYGVLHDITEKRLAELAKQKHELNFLKLVNAAPDPIIITDAQHNIRMINSQAEKLFGYNQSELKNKPIEMLISERYRVMHKNSISRMKQELTSDNITTDLELYGIKRDGSEFPADMSISSLETEQDMQFTYILRDISARINIEVERRMLQEQLAQAQKVEAIGHLTGGIAHDFNNVLGAVIGYASLLKDVATNTGKKDLSKQNAYVNQILIACNRAKELVTQMMVFSRINPTQNENTAPTILLQPVIKEVIQLLRSSMPSTINMNYQIEDDEIKARIEPVKLHQILLNLAINSRDAISDYGRINITTNQNHCEGKCNACGKSFAGDYIIVQVSDSGQGIPNEIIPKMFEPFFTTKEYGKGTGMGLSMVHSTVHGVGGHILVNSIEGEGTNFSVLLPQVSETDSHILEQPVRKTSLEIGKLANLHIMIVDDEQSMLYMLYELLTIYGANVTIYTHPQDAIAAFQRNPEAIDLLITDQTMPEYSGIDMCRKFRAIRPKLPIILCTGYSESVNANIAKQHGISAFMYKPLEIPQLLDAIQNVLVY